jgi:hypothetical protein
MKMTDMKTVMTTALVCLTLASPALLARDKGPPPIAKGSRIGVLNLLDAELMHYHAARDYKDSFVKLQGVQWPVNDMLNQTLQAQLAAVGLSPVPVTPTETLVRSREDCFVNAALVNGLPKNCGAALAQVASDAGVEWLIVMAPGLNNSDHTGTSNNAISESLRGWGFLTREQAGSRDKPTLFDDTELLLVAITPQGATLRGRQWGGTYAVKWQSYTPPSDPKALPPEQLDELQPLFGAMLSQQTKDLLAQVRVSPEADVRVSAQAQARVSQAPEGSDAQ